MHSIENTLTSGGGNERESESDLKNNVEQVEEKKESSGPHTDRALSQEAIRKRKEADDEKIADLKRKVQRENTESVESEKPVSPEELEEWSEKLHTLNLYLEDPEVGPAVKQRLNDPEVISTILGLKPVSSLQYVNNADGRLKLKENDYSFTIEDAQELKHILNYFNIKTKRIPLPEDQDMNITALQIHDPSQVKEAVLESRLFGAADEDLVEEDPEMLLDKYSAVENPGKNFSYYYKIGLLLGYPEQDVEDFIRLRKIKSTLEEFGISEDRVDDPDADLYVLNNEEKDFVKNKVQSTNGGQRIAVGGRHGSDIAWKSFNPNSIEVQQTRRRLQQAQSLAQKQLTADVPENKSALERFTSYFNLD